MFLATSSSFASPPKPLVHTWAEHYFNVELEDNLIEHEDQDPYKHTHIAIFRVVFDQPLFINGNVSIVNLPDLDGLVRLRCGKHMLESHCREAHTAFRNIPDKSAFRSCDHVFTTNQGESGAHLVTKHLRHHHDKHITLHGDLSNVYTAYIDLQVDDEDPIREGFSSDWNFRVSTKTPEKCYLNFLPKDEQTMSPPISITNAQGEVFSGEVPLERSTVDNPPPEILHEIWYDLQTHHLHLHRAKKKEKQKHMGKLKGIDRIRAAIAQGKINDTRIRGGAWASDVYAYLEVRNELRNTQEMSMEEATQKAIDPLLNMMIPEIKEKFIMMIREDTIKYMWKEIEKFLMSVLPCPIQRAIWQGSESIEFAGGKGSCSGEPKDPEPNTAESFLEREEMEASTNEFPAARASRSVSSILGQAVEPGFALNSENLKHAKESADTMESASRANRDAAVEMKDVSKSVVDRMEERARLARKAQLLADEAEKHAKKLDLPVEGVVNMSTLQASVTLQGPNNENKTAETNLSTKDEYKQSMNSEEREAEAVAARLERHGDHLAAKTFRAYQKRIHAVRALAELRLHPHNHGALRDYATQAYSEGFVAVRDVLTLLPRKNSPAPAAATQRFTAIKARMSQKGGEGLCQEQPSQYTCHTMLQLWEFNNVDGAPCSWCMLPPPLGGPKGVCEFMKHVPKLTQLGWVCSPKEASKAPTGNLHPENTVEPITENHEERDGSPRRGPDVSQLMGADVEMAQQFSDDMAQEIVSDVVRKVHLSTTEMLRQNINVSAISEAGALISVGVTQRVAPRLTHALASVLSSSITRMSTKQVTHHLVPALTHSLTATIAQALQRSPRDDFYCFFCKTSEVYCDHCNVANHRTYAIDYYGSYYAEYYGRYYTFYYGSVLADGFVDEALNKQV